MNELVHLGCPKTWTSSFTDAATIWKPHAVFFISFSSLFIRIGLREKWMKPALSGTCFNLYGFVQPLYGYMSVCVNTYTF